MATDDPIPPQLETLLERHLHDLEGYVRRNMRKGLALRESCSDLVQSVCREVLQRRGAFQYQGDENFRRWLLRVALHKLIDRRRYYSAALRAEPSRLDAPVTEWSHEALEALARTLLSPSGDLILREQLQELERALNSLGDSERTIIRLIHLEGLTHADVAARTGCTAAQSRQRLFRALVQLSGAMSAHRA